MQGRGQSVQPNAGAVDGNGLATDDAVVVAAVDDAGPVAANDSVVIGCIPVIGGCSVIDDAIATDARWTTSIVSTRFLTYLLTNLFFR